MKTRAITNDRLRRAVQFPRLIKENGFLLRLIFPSISGVVLTSVYLRFLLKIKRIIEICAVNREIDLWQGKKKEILSNGCKVPKATINDLGLDIEQRRVLEETQLHLRKVVIAEVDQDGFFLSYFGPIKDFPMVSSEQFVERKKYRIRLVLMDGNLLVEKDFRGAKVFFINELRTLYTIGLAGCNVPSIIDVDFDNCVLYLSFISGGVLREELAKKGAILRDRDAFNNSTYAKLNEKKKRLRRINEGKQKMYEVVDSRFVEELFVELTKIHSARFIWNDIKYGNIIIEEKTGRPFLVDFENARYYPNLNKNAFSSFRDKDIELFNLHFGKNYLSRERLKKQIKVMMKQDPHIYAPVYFGAGLCLGNIWNVQSGYGRWHYILKEHLPPFTGKRILDLGANNAYNSIQLLRNGAREVIGIELEDNQINLGRLVKAGFEWIDNANYNFKYIHANMKEIPTMNLGKFDMVLALCSLYYLGEEEIHEVAQYISTITDLFVLQCNTAVLLRSNPRTYEKASVDYALNIMENIGFSNVSVIAPSGYCRPLVIGKKQSSSPI